MRKFLIVFLVLVLALLFLAAYLAQGDKADYTVAAVAGTDPVFDDPESEIIPTVNIAEPVGWAATEAPIPAEGLAVTRFAEGLDHPRVIYAMPNGDVLVTLTNSPPREGGGFQAWIAKLLFSKAGAGEPSPDQLILLRDRDSDGRADQKFVLSDDLSSPSGIAYGDGTLYIANHDALLAFPYDVGATRLTAEPRKLMDLPGGGNHWMRNIILNDDNTRIYVAVGSASNIGENGMEAEEGRAAIWEYNLETNRQRLFATGLRNPNGLAFNPWSDELWVTVNERDMLGSDLVPDYLTNVPVGAQYGWPWVYYKDMVDERVDVPMPAFLTEYARYPEYALGPHVAALGLVFTEEGSRLSTFGQGAFIARHGSWNRVPASGYDVVFVRFDDLGNPQGKPVPVLTGFLNDDGEARGRPTWVEWSQDGALLVSDDTAGIIWSVVAPGGAPAPAIERVQRESLRPQRELQGDPSAVFEEEYQRESR
ncbi:sorbosone dehydrogenase family protein [Altererythrobacter sp. SALINAS58]|uniref:PQQ-dependent sugar dehydrogenase n=1 Tax=Alteripontixanthobacter muriae TaxID=2705546 RepID=UPI0015756CB8|nr:sorbosone dehydrogenase family protein [Alteripontixanthobacter muriae]NTZ43516.1 sorbosone dehydrogenase family protein [Alteripontixanthobacter muriae]